MKRIYNFALFRIFLIFAFLSAFLRTVFLVWEQKAIEFSFVKITESYFLGLFFDALTFGYIFFIPLLYYCLVPKKIFNSKKHQIANKIFYFLFLFIIIFSAFSEITFWEEFQARFNFIAVDYLIYTTEVIGNIMESYPIPLLVTVIFALSVAIFLLTYKKVIITKSDCFFVSLKNQLLFLLLSLLLSLVLTAHNCQIFLKINM